MSSRTRKSRSRPKPYNPATAGPQVHDRRAVEYSRGLQHHITSMEIDDPYELGARVNAARSTRDDPLGDMHSRKFIREDQYQAGRAFQCDFETAERGARAIDFTLEYVDGGLMPEPLTEAQRRAVRQLVIVYRALGIKGQVIVHEVLVHNMTRRQMAEARGLKGNRWEEYMGARLRECLDTLAEVYGFSQMR